MWSRLKSPVVWSVAITIGVAEMTKLQQKGFVNGWDIGIAIGTVCIAMFGAVNNPADRDNF